MVLTLDKIPYDILFEVTGTLNLDDVIHLIYTCRQLKNTLHVEQLCEKVVKTNAGYSKEAEQAQKEKITWSEAIKRIYNRRTAFSHAKPYSAQIVSQGTDFTHRQGVLCILDGDNMQVLDVQSPFGIHEIDLSPIINFDPGPSSSSPSKTNISLLYYSDEIIAIHYKCKVERRIFVVSTKPAILERVIQVIHLESDYKLFVRHTASYLYYGTYTGFKSNGHHAWEIRRVSLLPSAPSPPSVPPPSCDWLLQLNNFYGVDIGSTIAFHIHNGYFYAVSNQNSHAEDGPSYYHCVRFPLDLPPDNAPEVNTRLFRRWHEEGPIHDSWIDLTIQIDERTGQTVIVESRREWPGSSSKNLRTFYTTEIKFRDEENAIDSDGSPLLPESGRMTDLVDSNGPDHAQPKARHTWEFHHEFEPGSESASQSFNLSHTKARAYNLSCNAFLDLVEDEKCCSESIASRCLRIRVGSRPVVPVGRTSPDCNAVSEKAKVNTPAVENGTLRCSKIKLWPPPAPNCACFCRLHSILNPRMPSPDRHDRVVMGIIDEEGIVYMVRPGKTYDAAEACRGVIVLVNFTRDIEGVARTEDDVISLADDKVVVDTDSGQAIRHAVEEGWRWTRACEKGQCCCTECHKLC